MSRLVNQALRQIHTEALVPGKGLDRPRVGWQEWELPSPQARLLLPLYLLLEPKRAM